MAPAPVRRPCISSRHLHSFHAVPHVLISVTAANAAGLIDNQSSWRLSCRRAELFTRGFLTYLVHETHSRCDYASLGPLPQTTLMASAMLAFTAP